MNDGQVSNLFISSIGFFDILLHPAKTEKNKLSLQISLWTLHIMYSRGVEEGSFTQNTLWNN